MIGRDEFASAVRRTVDQAESLARLRRVAAGVREVDAGAAVERLLERIAARDDAEQLRAALVVQGAAAMLNAVRAATE